VNGAVTYTRWSRLNELRARLGNGSPDVVTPLNWKNSTRYSVGASYSLSDAWRLRAGLSYDESPTNDESRTPIIPDSSNTTFAVGATYSLAADSSFDIGYAHVFIRDASIRLSSPAGGNLVGTFSNPYIDLISVQYNRRF
jgi:long-chain fatty acid transport protein